MNLASRVEGLTKELGAPLLLSRATRDAALAAPGADPLHFTAAGEAARHWGHAGEDMVLAERSLPVYIADWR